MCNKCMLYDAGIQNLLDGRAHLASADGKYRELLEGLIHLMQEDRDAHKKAHADQK